MKFVVTKRRGKKEKTVALFSCLCPGTFLLVRRRLCGVVGNAVYISGREGGVFTVVRPNHSFLDYPYTDAWLAELSLSIPLAVLGVWSLGGFTVLEVVGGLES